MARPSDAKYTETHEWVRLGKQGEASVGITDYAVKQLSDLVHIELPKVGDTVEQGSPFGEIESVKTVADLVSPVTGKITDVNTKLSDSLDTLKESPYDGGWIVKVKVNDPAEVEALMGPKEYQEFLEQSEDEGGDEGAEDDVDEDDIV